MSGAVPSRPAPGAAARDRLPLPRRTVPGLSAPGGGARGAADLDGDGRGRLAARSARRRVGGPAPHGARRPLAKVATIFRTGFGLTITAGGLAQALHRLGARASPTYHALVRAVRRSPVVAPDETGWKVAGGCGGSGRS